MNFRDILLEISKSNACCDIGGNSHITGLPVGFTELNVALLELSHTFLSQGEGNAKL